jgi:prepilin-type N-terminal cleavage/methylation domain-containing protein/prepilin-type processing-associated H-X9-DG protein
MSGRSPKTGFTLIELLIVIAVIALLAAILFPVLAQARDKARAASCSSNLKQMGAAWLMYAQDYDETFPMASPGGVDYWGRCSDMKDRGSFGGWIGNLLWPYVKVKNGAVFKCPSNIFLSSVNNPNVCARPPNSPFWIEGYAREQWGIPYVWTSYGYNYVALWGKEMARVPRPADQIAIFDSISPWADCPYTREGPSECGIWYSRDIPAFLTKLGRPLHPKMGDPLGPNAPEAFVKGYIRRVAPHSNMLNMMFADGHVKATRWDKLTWGNLNGINIVPDTDPDYNVSLTTLPSKTWPGM